MEQRTTWERETQRLKQALEAKLPGKGEVWPGLFRLACSGAVQQDSQIALALQQRTGAAVEQRTTWERETQRLKQGLEAKLPGKGEVWPGLFRLACSGAVQQDSQIALALQQRTGATVEQRTTWERETQCLKQGLEAKLPGKGEVLPC